MATDFLFEVAKKAVLSSINDMDAIFYRQNILKDCLRNTSVVKDIYALAVETIGNEKKRYHGISSKYPASTLHGAIELLQMFAGMLEKLRATADEHTSTGK